MHEQNSPAWLEFRKNKVGASDAPIIMGVSKWKTPYQLWEEKLGLRADAPRTRSQERGLQMEEKARQQFEAVTGIVVVPHVMQHKEHEWMIASLDGIDFEGKHIVEIKCPGAQDHATALDGEVPEHYKPQLQHQMEVTGLQMAYYFSFDGEAGCVIEVYRDDQYIKEMVDKEHQFWECLQTLEAPKACDRDYVQRNDDMWLKKSAEWKETKTKLEFFELKEQSLREELVSMSGASHVRGGGVTLVKYMRKGSIDYRAIPEIKGLDLEPYRRDPSETWRITSVS